MLGVWYINYVCKQDLKMAYMLKHVVLRQLPHLLEVVLCRQRIQQILSVLLLYLIIFEEEKEYSKYYLCCYYI
jgi:hypothetical protein